MAERLLNVVALVIVVISSTCVVNLYANRDAGALIAVQQKEVIDQYHDQNVTYRDVVREITSTFKKQRHQINNLEEKVMQQSAEIARLEKLCKDNGVATDPFPFGVFHVK